MSCVQLVYTKQALAELKTLNKKTAIRMVNKISENSRLSNPLLRAKALQGSLSGRYRYRIGTYRAIFQLENENYV